MQFIGVFFNALFYKEQNSIIIYWPYFNDMLKYKYKEKDVDKNVKNNN